MVDLRADADPRTIVERSAPSSYVIESGPCDVHDWG